MFLSFLSFLVADTLGRIHHGENKAAIPKVWALAEKEKFKVVKEAFIAFLSTCYSECSLFAITQILIYNSCGGAARARFT